MAHARDFPTPPSRSSRTLKGSPTAAQRARVAPAAPHAQRNASPQPKPRARRSRSRARAPRDAASLRRPSKHSPTADPLLSSSHVICTHRPPCPGCPRFGERGIAGAAQRALNDLAEKHALPQVSVISGQMTGFRQRARLAIRGRLGSPKLGLFELGTHHVVHIPNCVVQHPLINRVAGVVRKALADAKVTPYSDRAHLGLARYLQVVVERSSETAQVVLVCNSEDPEPVATCLDAIRERLGADLHSLWWNGNTQRTNTILGPEFRRICGPETVVER